MCSVFGSQWITSYLGWFCCWFSLLSLRGFPLGTSVFSSPQKPIFLNSISFRDMLNEGPLWWCAIFKILFKFYFFIVVGFRSLPERFYTGFFLFLVPLKTFQNEQTSTTQSVLCLVSCAAVFSVVTQTGEEATQRTAVKETNLWWMKSSSVVVLPQIIYILYFILFCCCYLPSKTSHAELNFNDCYQSSTDRIAFFFFLFHFFVVGVALVPRPLFKSSSILCQETLWQKGTGTNSSAREEHTSQSQSGNNLLPLAQFTRAY